MGTARQEFVESMNRPTEALTLAMGLKQKAKDDVHHPQHYTSHPSGVECITVVEHMNFNLGNAIKYLWRADSKGAPIQDLQKAVWYITREIERRRKFTEAVEGAGHG